MAEYDVIIIGAGPGGYVAGIRASQLGLKAVVIEKNKPGGVCLNIGCIPSKALIHEADTFRSIADLEKMGVKVDSTSFDYSHVFKKSRKAADMLSKGVQFLLKKNKVDYVAAEATITGENEVTLSTGDKLTGKNIMIATGSRPIEIPGFEFDGEKILSSDHALMLEKLPEKAVILGAGAIGCEFSHIWNGFGVEVHIVELLDQLLPLEDPEITPVLERSFKKRGIKVHTSTKATGVIKNKNGVVVSTEDKNGKVSEIEADVLLVVVGRKPNTEAIGLENAGIATDLGFIDVKDYYQTSVPSVYAIGDVVASPLLAHVASKEAEIAIEYMAGHKTIAKIDPDTIPGAVYCEPQVASFGKTEKQCKEQNIDYKKATFPYRGAGKSVAIGKSEGMVKVIFNPETKELLGCHIIGAEATELIHELLLAKTSELLPEDIATMIHAHPTLSETLMEVMRAAEGWVIHA